MDIKKYNVPVPRYTSYPTVPFWNDQDFTIDGYVQSLDTAYWASGREAALYIHLPFCESLCTYCACNTRITKNHGVEDSYIDYLLTEWSLYLEKLPDTPVIREIHLGGGTPTFFSASNLERLIEGIFRGASRSSELSMSFEGHPANTTEQHLKRLYRLGFDRLSLGIQDFDERVQKLINRVQTFEQVEKITKSARDIGYTSMNYDVVYGLPGQDIMSLEETLSKVILLSPDRIAYYSYAHVPELRPAQRSYEQFLPQTDQKFLFMKQGRETLRAAGYHEIGMDHFVKEEDELLQALENGNLHRNFMGYTPFPGKLLIGLGASAIGDSWTGFAQNAKSVEAYYERIDTGTFPVAKGHLLTREDLFFRQQILNLMCDFRTTWNEHELMEFGISVNYELLVKLHEEGFINLSDSGIEILYPGREILRVICTAMDARMNTSGRSPRFSAM